METMSQKQYSCSLVVPLLQNYDLINIWSHVTSSKHKEVLDIVRLREREGHRVDSGGHSKVIK